MPPPFVLTGVSPCFGQNLLFLNTLFCHTTVLPAPPGCPSSSTRTPWQLRVSQLPVTRTPRACLMKIPNCLPMARLSRTTVAACRPPPTHKPPPPFPTPVSSATRLPLAANPDTPH